MNDTDTTATETIEEVQAPAQGPTFLEDSTDLREIQTLSDGRRFIEVEEKNILHPTERKIPLGFWVVTSAGKVMVMAAARSGKKFRAERAAINALGIAATKRDAQGELLRTWLETEPESRGEMPEVEVLPEALTEALEEAARSMLTPNYGSTGAADIIDEGMIDMVILDDIITIATGANPGYRVQVKSKNPTAPESPGP